MASRLDLQTFLEELLKSKNVYFQPPESVKMKYPAIVYALDDIENVHADNGVYSSHRHYSVTVIDSDPDSELVGTVYAKLIELCTDICKRYGKTKLLWFGDKTKTLNYEPASNEMVLTVHRWFANKSCPGDWMYARMGDLASKVTAKLGGSAGGTEKPADNQALYRVQTGAFSNKTNADAMLQKVKDAGFDTYMVKVDNLYKIQVGAFSKKANADAMAAKLKAAGFDTYITTKSGTAVSASSAKKSTDQIAREVIQGLWGNGADRTNRLKAAGYDPSVIQNRVNQLLK